jgi:hypothetical protein
MTTHRGKRKKKQGKEGKLKNENTYFSTTV